MKGGSVLAGKVTKEKACSSSSSEERALGVKNDVFVRKEKKFNTLNQRFSNRCWKKTQSSKRMK
jgi:hypothetical protein